MSFSRYFAVVRSFINTMKETMENPYVYPHDPMSLLEAFPPYSSFQKPVLSAARIRSRAEITLLKPAASLEQSQV